MPKVRGLGWQWKAIKIPSKLYCFRKHRKTPGMFKEESLQGYEDREAMRKANDGRPHRTRKNIVLFLGERWEAWEGF